MAGIPAFGTILQVGDGATPTEAFADIAELADVPGLNPSVNLVDDTTHNQTDPVRHFTPTLINAGTMALRVNYDPDEVTHSEASGLGFAFWQRRERNYRLVLNSLAGGKTWTFPAVIQNYNGPSSPIDGIYGLQVTFQVNGRPTAA